MSLPVSLSNDELLAPPVSLSRRRIYVVSGVSKLEENIRKFEPDYVEGFYNAVGDELAAEDVSVTMLGVAVIELSRAGLEPATKLIPSSEGFFSSINILNRLQPPRSTSGNSHSYLFAGIHVTHLPQDF